MQIVNCALIDCARHTGQDYKCRGNVNIDTLNGNPGAFTATDDERYVFDKNMMQLTQTSTIKIEAEIPTIDKTKHGFVGVGINSKLDPAVTLGIRSIWLYGDSDTKAGGLMYRF